MPSQYRALDLAAAAIPSRLGAGVFFWARYGAVRVPANGKYVAVLPFHVLAADAVLQFDSEGITEALSSRLFADPSLHPISPIALETVDMKQPTAVIAKQVGANLVVAGAIFGQPDGQLLVSAHIENVQQHTTIWRTRLKGSQRQLLQMEDQLCDQVLRALGDGAAAATAPVEPNLNQEAYDLYLEGRNLLKNRADDQRVTQALDLFQQACAKDPAFALAWAGVADASLLRYNATHESIWAEKALDAAQRARSRNDKLPEVHLSLGSVYTQTGKTAEAIAEILSALKLEPNSDDAYVRLGRAYRKIGKTDYAINALKKAVELNPYYWYNHDQLGKEYFRTGRNAEALKEFRKVVELDPNNAGGYNEIGSVYTRQNRWADSIPEFQHSLALKPTSDAYGNLGTAYFFLDRYSQAADIFEKAVGETPNDVWLQGNLADAYRQAKRGAAAAKAYDRAIQMAYERLRVNPHDPPMLGLLATFDAKNGNAPKALELIAQARAIDASDSQLMYWEAVIFALAGRPSDAMHSLDRALSNGYSVHEARHDPDLSSLQHDPAFQSLLKQYH